MATHLNSLTRGRYHDKAESPVLCTVATLDGGLFIRSKNFLFACPDGGRHTRQ